MTRRLLLIRHAEAASTPPGATDHDRPLTAYGDGQAVQIGRLIARGVLPRPELALTSDAVRAQQTWAAASSVAGLTASTIADRTLYGATFDELVALVRVVPDGVGVLALVGHAPEIPSLARTFDDARPAGSVALAGWPAAGVGVIEIDGDWSEFPDVDARLVFAAAVEPGDD